MAQSHFSPLVRSLIIPSVLALALFSTSACVSSRTAGWKGGQAEVTLSESERAALQTSAMAHWEKRLDQKELEAALADFEKLANGDPTNLEALTYLSRGYYFLADSHLEDMETKKSIWEKGTTWGERALAVNPEFRKKVVDEGKFPEEALDALDQKFAAPIYWTAVNLGKWAKASGVPTQLKFKGRISAYIQRVEKLDPDYFFGAADRYWGVFYAVAPGFAGGSMEKSIQHFNKSLKTAPNYLATHVLLAENYATKKGDQALFKKHLQTVLSTPANAIPEMAPENELEKKKAQKMLDTMADYF